MPFNLTFNVSVVRDTAGVVRSLEHLQQPYTPPVGLAAPNAQNLAGQYLQDVAAIYSIPQSMIQNLGAPLSPTPTQDPVSLRFAEEKSLTQTTLISFVQTVLGLPIWEAGFSVSLLPSPLRTVSSVSSVHLDVQITPPRPDAPYLKSIEPAVLGRLLGITTQNAKEAAEPRINSTRLLVYQYDPNQRYDPEFEVEGPGLIGGPPILSLPPVPEGIIAGRHYVVREVLFTWPVPGIGDVHWRAFIEVETGAVLYLRAALAAAKGFVYLQDPVTALGGPLPTAPAAQLDPLRTLEILPDVTASNPQALSGEFVQIADTSPPTAAPPTEASGNFLYSVPTDNFSAVNAYYHVDSLFRMVRDMGYSIADVFDGTIRNPGFPVPVDFRALNDAVNAQGLGNSTMDGSGGFLFGRADSGATVGIADDPRVVAHEFCHALLWDAVNSPNFGFSHSAGDSIGAVLNDPGSEAPDRFLTFPWITAVPRRHDRPVGGGWAWGGTMDTGGYNSEQILSTTLFRAYQAIGGDSGDFNTQTWAAQYLVYLIVGGIASLATSPITPTPRPDIYATAMMNADAGILGFDGQPGGEIRKVIRWSFEKQGLYQPAGAPVPVTTPGAPPSVDVYIDDGRNGEYQYLGDFWETTDIWNRLAADGGTAHQTPIVNVTNYAYVRVKNRGSNAATNVVVSGFHCRPSTGLVWPDDWQTMTTPSLSVSGGISAGGTVIVGPFQWTPTEVGHECMLMSVSALGDLSNNDPATSLPCASGPIPHYRLVPFDNNIAQRNVAPVPGGGGGLRLAEALKGRHFWVNNPYERSARVTINVQMPDFLRQRGWEVTVASSGGNTFSLGPRSNREVILGVQPGADFSPQDVTAAGSSAVIRLETLIDGLIVGGMTYAVDPTLRLPAPEHPTKPEGAVCKEAAQELLECLDLPTGHVRKVRIKRVTIDIDLEEECD